MLLNNFKDTRITIASRKKNHIFQDRENVKKNNTGEVKQTKKRKKKKLNESYTLTFTFSLTRIIHLKNRIMIIKNNHSRKRQRSHT
jgi:hypothetical protein